MNLRQYLDSLPHGGITEFARLAGITPVYLSQLGANQDGRVPSPTLCNVIFRLSEGVVTRQELRPDDYWLIWPDLPSPVAETQGA